MIAAGRRKTFWESLGETQGVVSLLVLYCAVFFLVRFGLSPNLTGAEAREMLFGQSFQWGYRPGHPPLTAWLAWIALTAGQGSRLALFLLREVLLAIGLMAFFAAARTVLDDVRRAGLATFFLLAAYGVGWLLQWGSMENVLLFALCCLYIWADTRALTYERTVDYLVLGAVTGLGVLSSYVFLLLPFAMSAALAFTPDLRARLRLLPLVPAAAITLIVVAPYFALAPNAVAFTTSGTPALAALCDLVVALVVFALPALLIFAALYRRALRPLPAAQPNSWIRFFRTAIFVAAVPAFVLVLLFRPGDIRAWAYPVLLPLPLYLFARAKPAHGAEAERWDKRFLIAVAAFVAVGIALRVWMYETRAHDCRHCAEYWPLARYADTFRQAGFLGGTIAAPDAALGGNLRLVFPDARVVTPDAPALRFGPAVAGECLVVWEGDGNLPQRLGRYVEATYGAKLKDRAMQGDVEAMLLTSHGRLARLNFLILAQGACDHPRG